MWHWEASHLLLCHPGQQIFAWTWPMSKRKLSWKNGYLSLRLQLWMPKSAWKIASTWEVWWVHTVTENVLILCCNSCMLFHEERERSLRFWVGLEWRYLCLDYPFNLLILDFKLEGHWLDYWCCLSKIWRCLQKQICFVLCWCLLQ
jgi:hypothetical protein